MAEPNTKKRAGDEASRIRTKRPAKRQKKKQQQQYHSDSEDDDRGNDEDFQAVNLADSDDDDGHEGARVGGDDDDGDGFSDGDSSDDGLDSASSVSDGPALSQQAGSKSKRNDPEAFATSMSKILSTKLSSSRRVDPVLARSATAHQAGRQAVDAALDARARNRMREQKRAALEKGHVRDVLAPEIPAAAAATTAAASAATTTNESAATAQQILETERRLRKVAQRGVVKLFNAVRAAQVKAAEAERELQQHGSTAQRHGKITQMSRQGFLDLLASGGGRLKKGGLEEA